MRLTHSLLGSVVACSLVVLAGCGDDDSDAASSASTSSTSSASSGEWSFTDGSGRTTTLPERPTRIVAHGAAAAGLIPLGIRPVGIFADTKIAEDLALSHLDLDGIEIVGEEWGVVNVEAVAALEPDLIVAEWWPLEEAYSGLEDGTSGPSQQLQEISPFVGVAQGPSIQTMIEDYEALATSLGADLDQPEIASAREWFEGSLAGFQEALAAKPDLSVMAISPTPESLYVAVPEYAAELSDFARWGMQLVVPENPDDGFEYWETLSWENADKYQADLLIIDERSYPTNLEDAAKQPTWPTLKAAAAGAVAVWPAYWLRNYADYAAALDELTAAIEKADETIA